LWDADERITQLENALREWLALAEGREHGNPFPTIITLEAIGKARALLAAPTGDNDNA
jgi:hypothetical protein